MASPSVVGTPTETAISTAGTSHVVNLPSGATGNLLIAIMDKGSTSATVNSLTGWNELLDENSANGLYIAWRTCDGTEGATTTFTLSASTRGAWIVYEISGHINPATQPPEIGTTASGSSTAPDPPSVSVTGGSKDILTIACFGRGGEEADDDTWVTAAPGGFGSLLQKACGTVGTNLGGMVATAHLAQTTATANPGAFTCATGAWRAQTIVVHPAPTQTSVARISLASGGTPTTQTAHKIKVRARTTSGAGTIKAALYEGASNRSGDLESSALTTSLADYTLSIPDASAANITDYSNLEIRLWGYAVSGGSIVFEVDQLWLEIPASSGTSNPQALTATVTSTASFTNKVGKIVSATATSTATMVRRVGKNVSATVTSIATAVKRVSKPLTATVTSTASLAAIRVVLLALTATVTSTASMVRRTGKIVSTTVTTTASFLRLVAKAMSATVTSTATVGAIKVILKALTATVTSTATIARSIGLHISAAATSTATIVKQVGKRISATSTTTASVVKQIGKILSATAATTASLVGIKVILRTLTATVTSSATMVRSISFHLSATATATASVVKRMSRSLSATVTSTATLSASRAFLKALTATVTTSATIVRSVGFALTATVTTSGSIVKQVSKTLTAGVSSVASMVADFISGTISFTLGFFDRPTPGGDTNDGSPEAGQFDSPGPGRSM